MLRSRRLHSRRGWRCAARRSRLRSLAGPTCAASQVLLRCFAPPPARPGLLLESAFRVRAGSQYYEVIAVDRFVDGLIAQRGLDTCRMQALDLPQIIPGVSRETPP